ncbi:unnamed protein product [Hymenolepis diminuta]|uniref:CCHC-type domain-containing protein n=1 Tax=Hymenolepis diminuta TaxID=6216 RepID=A0A0R3SWX3_HYMDI|nr:unnamed protein product [Hymenolepis diminuta]
MDQPKSAKKNHEEERINLFLNCFPEDYISILKENHASVKCKQGTPYVFCKCCNKTFKSAQETIVHMSSKEHIIIKETKHFLSLMRYIPSITESHRKALNDELSSVVGNFIDETEIKKRIECAEKYRRALEARIPGLKLSVYGNFLMGLAKNFDPVQLNATYGSLQSKDDGAEKDSLFLKILGILAKSPGYQDQPPLPESDRVMLTNGRVCCRMVDSKGNVYIEISMITYSVEFASLIRTYYAIDSRAKHLTQLLIVFSRVANLSRTLSIPVMCVMVIFFLQRLSPPLLPNLHEIVRKYHETFSINCVTKVVSEAEDLSYLSDLTVLPKFFSTNDSFTLGDLWLKFLRFYVCEFQHRDYLISIVSSDPVKKSARKIKSLSLFVEGTSLISDMTVHMDRFINDQLLAAYVYFGIPRLKGASMPLFTDYNIEPSKALRRTLSLGSDGNNKYPLLSIPVAEFKTRAEKISSAVSKGGKLIDIAVEVLQLAISEICLPQCKIDVKKSYRKKPCNLLPSYAMGSLLDTSQTIEFARICCRNLWNAAHNDLKEGASKVQLLVLGREVVQKALENIIINTTGVENGEAGDRSSSESAEAMEHSGPIEESTERNGELESNHEYDENLAEEVTQSDTQESAWSKCIKIEDQYKYIVWDSEKENYYNSAVIRKLKPEDLAFPFSLDRLSSEHFIGSSIIAHLEQPPIGCSHCDATGHLSSECPATNLQYWKDLESSIPKVTNRQHLRELSETFLQLAQYHKLSAEMAARHQYVVESLTTLFRQSYPDVSLVLFGSCANGFETKTSDMDICVVFPDNSPNTLVWYNGTFNEKQGLLRDFKRILSRKANSLRISNIRPVFQAKVPIIKFLVDRVIEVDLSFSNFLAIYNTRMLRLYNEYEPRLRVLNTVLKIVLKNCGIPKSCDGGISSYAYAIMLIHYLQRRGYLPYLQEAYESKNRPNIIVSDWNVWFQEDKQIVLKSWQPPKRETTIAELWLGFLHYYLFEFDRNTYKVTIDTKKLAPRVTSTNSFVIKDPFDLSHNMTQFVHAKLIIQIFTTFYNVLLHHSTAIRNGMNSDLWKQSLFSSTRLSAKLDNFLHEKYRQKSQGGKRKNKATAPANGKPTTPAKPVQNSALLGPSFPSPKLNPVLTQVVATQDNQPRGHGVYGNRNNVNAAPSDRVNYHPQPPNSHNQPASLSAFAQQVHITPVQPSQRNPMNSSLVVGVPHQRSGRGGNGRGGQSHRRGGRGKYVSRGFTTGVPKTNGRSGLLQ